MADSRGYECMVLVGWAIGDVGFSYRWTTEHTDLDRFSLKQQWTTDDTDKADYHGYDFVLVVGWSGGGGVQYQTEWSKSQNQYRVNCWGS